MSIRTLLAVLAGFVVGIVASLPFRRSTPIGSRSAQDAFILRNKSFLRALPRVRGLIRAAVDRELSTGPAADRVIHLLARGAADDFEEILTLAANGFGFGALALLRGMYERTVTAFHLHKHPGEAETYLDYHWIQRRKLAKAIGQSIEKPLTAELIADLETKFQAVKGNYEVVVCHKCGAKDVNFRWHKLDLVAMAKATGVDSLKDLLVRAYYVPLEHAHSTAGSLLFQIKDVDGKPVLVNEQDPMYADHAVAVAHLLVMLAAAAVRMQLNIAALQPMIDECAKDHTAAWPNL